MQLTESRDSDVERSDERLRDDGNAVLEAFSIAHDQRPCRQIDILDSKAEGFEETQPASVEKAGNHPIRTAQLLKEAAHFVTRQNDRKALWPAGACDVAEPRKADFQNAL